MDDDYYYRRSIRRNSSRRVSWVHYVALVVLILLAMPVLRAIFTATKEVSARPPASPLDYAPSVANQAVQDYAHHMMEPLRQSVMRNAYVQQSRASYRAPASVGRQLQSDERCIGGSIVRVDVVDGVPTYTQESDGAHPVACPQTNF